MKLCVIWDLCQTLADTRHRLHHILKKPANWPEYDKHMMKDKPYAGSKLIYCAMMSRDVPQIIITGRGERTREMCNLWMMQHGMLHQGLYMRPEKDNTPSDRLKRELLTQARADGWHPVLAFEDHPATVSMYRSEGIQVFAADNSSWTNGEFCEVLSPVETLR